MLRPLNIRLPRLWYGRRITDACISRTHAKNTKPSVLLVTRGTEKWKSRVTGGRYVRRRFEIENKRFVILAAATIAVFACREKKALCEANGCCVLFFFFNKTAVRSIKKQLASYTVPGIGQSTEKTSRYASNVAMARKIETIVSKPLKRKRTSLHRVLTIENSRNRLKTLCDRWI